MNADKVYTETGILPIRDLIAGIASLPVSSVLDLGCGEGKTMKILSDKGLKCVGIDTSPKMLKKARDTGEVMLSRGENLPFRDKVFDIIILKEVIHHIADSETLLSEVKRCLKDNGYVWILEPTEDDPILHFGRKVYPYWRGSKVETRLYAEQLKQLIMSSGFLCAESGGINGSFPFYILFWVKETMWQIIEFMRLPWQKIPILNVYLRTRIQLGYQGKAMYYWCLARKKA